MDRVVVGLVVAAVAAIAALLVRRRRGGPLDLGMAHPAWLDRDDFPDPDARWLVVLFSSATCTSCESVRRALEPLPRSGPEGVAVVEVEYSARRDLHLRYAVDAVPMTLVADREGAVHASFVGRTTTSEVAAALVDRND